MGANRPQEQDKPPRATSRMPEHSAFFDKVVPVLLVVLGVVMLLLMLFAAAVLLGLVRF